MVHPFHTGKHTIQNTKQTKEHVYHTLMVQPSPLQLQLATWRRRPVNQKFESTVIGVLNQQFESTVIGVLNQKFESTVIGVLNQKFESTVIGMLNQKFESTVIGVLNQKFESTVIGMHMFRKDM